MLPPLDGRGTNKRVTQVKHMHAHIQSDYGVESLQWFIGTRRRREAPSVNIGENS